MKPSVVHDQPNGAVSSAPEPDVPAPAAAASAAAHPNQFSLLAQRRFAPFFWTQFLGAGNDNVFKFAFTIMVTYQLQVSWMPPAMAGLLIGALFILPYLLFSATSGQITDKFEQDQDHSLRQESRNRHHGAGRLRLSA